MDNPNNYKCAVVTGANRGIGFETTIQLLKAGISVIAVSRSIDALNQIKNEYPHLTPLKANLTNIVLTTSLIREQTSQIDLLINNAAHFLKQDLSSLTADEMAFAYNVNVIAPALLSQSLLELMPKKSHIVNISSMGGVSGSLKFKTLLPYSITKGALNILTECLAVELEDKKVFCNALALGSCETEMFKSAFPNQKAASHPAEMGKFIANFSLTSVPLLNGKVVQLSSSAV